MKFYSVTMTKVYEVKVIAKNKEHAEELFDRYADWDELLKVHTLYVNEADKIVLSEGHDY